MMIDRKNKEKKKEKKEDENDDNKVKFIKNSKKKMEISWGGVTRPPRQFESYSLSASSKSYSGGNYSAPKPD